MKKRNIKPYGQGKTNETWGNEYSQYLGEYAEGYEEFTKDIAYDIEKFNDPLFIGALIHRLVQERKATKQMFEELLGELKRIEQALKNLEERLGPSSLPITSGEKNRSNLNALPDLSGLAEADERIIQVIKERGKATADEVKQVLGYKGRNAASARLNKLWQLGFLTKRRAGRKVYYYLAGGREL